MTEFLQAKITRLRTLNAGYGQIADVTGINKQTVRSWCKRHNLGGVRGKVQSKKENSRKQTSHVCRNCGNEITDSGKGRPRVFCSTECSKTYWSTHRDIARHNKKSIYALTCPACHRHFNVYGDSRRKYCSHSCYIASRFYGAKE